MSRALAGLLALVLALTLAACSKELSLEQQVTATLRNMEAHIEAGERREFMENIAEDFHGQGGELDRDQLSAMLLYQLHRHKRVNAQLFPVEVLPAGVDEAQATFRVLLTGGEGLLPDTGQLYQVTSFWQLQDGEWRMRSAQWQVAAPGEG
jgi:outer membrane lipopolysaccharide assembly protein LptE/RlpB